MFVERAFVFVSLRIGISYKVKKDRNYPIDGYGLVYAFMVWAPSRHS